MQLEEGAYGDGRRSASFVPRDIILSHSSPTRMNKSVDVEWSQISEIDIRVDVADVVAFTCRKRSGDSRYILGKATNHNRSR